MPTARAQPEGEAPFRLIAERFALDDTQIAYARLAGVRNAQDFYSLLIAAPELGEQGVFDTPDLTERLIRETSVSAMIQLAETASSPLTMRFGATAPHEAPFGEPGTPAPDMAEAELRSLASFVQGPLAEEAAIEATHCPPWPIRDQGSRGTCVSFATTAAYELYLCATQTLAVDLSEQFLYWAIKHHRLDPIPSTDGTWHEFAAMALGRFGICTEADWPYDPTMRSNVSHDPPPPSAVTSARALRTPQAVATPCSGTTGKAAALLRKLRMHNGVAIALPVFDAPSRRIHNWATRAAQTYGEVQNPLPGWSVSGGHAVCCVGFQPDPYEPLGGHFVIRNSWGTAWGHGLPDPSYAGPEPGYGQVSASYVDRYLWEDCVF